jgi:hypothetical protein
MENKEFLEALKFGLGDGNLQYYLYNWRCPPIPPNQVCLTTFFLVRIYTNICLGDKLLILSQIKETLTGDCGKLEVKINSIRYSI